ncbi:low temperature requirement protein A [Micromonospora rifamycinica]|uniref:low temperature requirement protein A n=1 Tax=Micromonospora rifamycinica TaxID=291594 RepID=UPI0033F4B67E
MRRDDPAPHPTAGGRRLVARDPGAIGDVSWVELFVDLLFVFAFLAVTTLMGEHFSPLGLLQGVLVILLLWHCWTPCVWLGNVVHLDRGIMPPVMLGIAAALLVIGVAIPEAFTDRPGGLPGPLVLICGYLLIRATAMVVLTFVSHRGEGGRRSVVVAWLIFIAGGLVLLASAVVPPLLPATVDAALVQVALFAGALLIDSLILVVASRGGWRVVSPWHLAERHALVVLIALGETIISIGASEGLGVDRPVTLQLAVGAVLGIIVVFALWWSYFDLAKVIIERALNASAGKDRARVGRDVYSGLHLPMIGGLIFFALGLKHLNTHESSQSGHPWPSAGTTILYGGVLLYLGALVAVEWRAVRLLGRGPLVGVAMLLVLLPVVAHISEAQALVVLVVAACAMVALDNTAFRRRHRQLHEAVESDHLHVGSVDPRELFVDLVFVYAFIEVTAVMNRFPTLLGLAQGMILLALLWWAWTSYTWLANAVRRDSTVLRLSTAGIMTAVLLIGLAIPQAFVPLPGSLPGPLLVIGFYFFILLMQGLIFRQIVHENPQLRGGRDRFAATAATVVTLVILAAIAVIEVAGPERVSRHPAMTLLWAVALVVQYVGGYRAGERLWQIRVVRHWADRHALVILIAFGEAVLSIGVSIDDEPISAPTLVVVVATVVALGTLWWSYFTGIDAARIGLAAAMGDHRVGVARDAYTYLHLPMVAGIVLVAYGLHQTLAASQDRHSALLGHYTLFLGVALYLVGNQLFWLRVFRTVSRHRLIGAGVVAVLAPLTVPLPSVVSLLLLTVLGVVFAVVEAVQQGDPRTRLPVRT